MLAALLYLPSDSTSLIMTFPMDMSPSTRSFLSAFRSVTRTFSSHEPSPTTRPSCIILKGFCMRKLFLCKVALPPLGVRVQIGKHTNGSTGVRREISLCPGRARLEYPSNSSSSCVRGKTAYSSITPVDTGSYIQLRWKSSLRPKLGLGVEGSPHHQLRRNVQNGSVRPRDRPTSGSESLEPVPSRQHRLYIPVGVLGRTMRGLGSRRHGQPEEEGGDEAGNFAAAKNSNTEVPATLTTSPYMAFQGWRAGGTSSASLQARDWVHSGVAGSTSSNIHY
ncbi:hypothetical protein Bbelb_375010 [Branchiostoma belcheri]|nr:hypothetical protein Bbelb_375010 [Branchiostoma belcheri]